MRVERPLAPEHDERYLRPSPMSLLAPRRPGFSHGRPVRALGCALVASLAVGCGGKKGTAKQTEPTGPPRLRIAELLPAGSPPWRPGDDRCLPLGRDSRRTTDVVLDTKGAQAGAIRNFTLRPPLGCAGTLQCGYVLLTVGTPDRDGGGPLLVSGAAATSISAPLDDLTTPPERLAFRVELRTELGFPVEDEGGSVIFDQVVVDLCSSAPPLPDGGLADASADGGPGDAAVVDASDASRDRAPPDAPLDAPSRDVIVDGRGGDASPGPSDGAAADGPSDAAADATADASVDASAVDGALDAATGG